ncbi:hypothetical protein PSEUBRA_004691 [Kalmanozyma brasiliensis GHG001]|uniref:uncharacterized protein n=1 Tax=Kalmanozyma brasiliensis (strain GHG001) TaxID=1365824 RepID=UPI0028681475|nr:uncharacterized protein PSEUBRA_004691 [Kalmanozyma brasiliensis GHG001]KAF6767411.1 hypothetical protein PSEUBRA_004691 [Kalmanozyma brasiliensis GHG001]
MRVSLRFPLSVLLLCELLVIIVAAAPLAPIRVAAEAEHGALASEVYNSAGELLSTSLRSPTQIASSPLPRFAKEIRLTNAGEHWLVHPKDIPSLARPRGGLWRSLRFGRSPARVEITKNNNIKMINDGSTPRLFRFGSADKTYYVLPHTKETLHGNEVTQTQYKAHSIHKLPKDTGAPYSDLAL